jgi:hypothetical protein
MSDQEEEHKLDVDFEVMEYPRDEFFPRMPNIVSHRGHQLRITAIIRDVPEGTTHIGLQADVLVYGAETISEHGHASSSVRLWGHAPERSFPVNEDTLFPHPIDILVTKSLDDDHLGEGPYGTFINITAANTPFVDEAPAEESVGTAEDGEAGSGSGSITVRNGHTFEVDFVSK